MVLMEEAISFEFHVEIVTAWKWMLFEKLDRDNVSLWFLFGKEIACHGCVILHYLAQSHALTVIGSLFLIALNIVKFSMRKKKSFVVNNETWRNCEWTVKKCHFLWTKIWRQEDFSGRSRPAVNLPVCNYKARQPDLLSHQQGCLLSSLQFKSTELTFIIFGFHLISMNSVWRHFAHIKFC